MVAVYRAPRLVRDELGVLALIEGLRSELRHRVHEPRRWSGGLRRIAEGRAVQGSNNIEGYNATLDDIFALRDGDEPMDINAETRLALEGYQEAMTYILQAGQDPHLRVDEGLLRALHFMMVKHDLSKNPGRWRPGAIHIVRSGSNVPVYTGPGVGDVPSLIENMLEELGDSEAPVLVKAAIAHLNLVMIHPFSDGNGRMARCLQTLVLTREQIAAPVFSSIEEYLGRRTDDYYAVLGEVGQGAWHPENDARPWVRFCLTAHYRQAQTLLRRLRAFEELWLEAKDIVTRRRLPERAIGPIAEAAYGIRIRRATYISNVETTWGERVPELTASRDLRALVNAGLLTPIGDTRGRHYVGSDDLKALWTEVRGRHPREENDDPFQVVDAGRAQGILPLETREPS